MKAWAIDNNKPCWWFAKSQQKRTDAGNIVEDSKEKAETLNWQFQSVFTQEDGNKISWIDGSAYPQVHNLTINVRGVENYYRKWKSTKPDDLPAVFYEELVEETAHYYSYYILMICKMLQQTKCCSPLYWWLHNIQEDKDNSRSDWLPKRTRYTQGMGRQWN